MIVLYGIKNCDSVRKARKLLQENNREYLFQDFREKAVDEETIRDWIDKGVTIKELFNTRGTTYRTLKLKDVTLTDEDKIKWLAKENMLIKRPVIVDNNGSIVVSYDENKISSILN